MAAVTRLGFLLTLVASAVAVGSVVGASAAQANITLRNTSSAVTPRSQTWLSIPKPGGVVAGDVLVAGVSLRLTGGTVVNAPKGWALVRRDSATAGASLTQATFVRVAGASEPSSYMWTFGTATGGVAEIAAYSGVDANTPVAVSSGRYTANTNQMVAPSVTTTAAARLVGFFGNNGTKSTTPPSGMTELVDRSVGTSWGSELELADTQQSSPGVTGDEVALSADPSNSSSIGQQVALLPAGGGGGGGGGGGLGGALPAPIPPSTGQAFYVSTTGSDSNPGTLSSPWLTIQHALDVLQPGQTALVRGGTYTAWETMSRSGTALAPITLSGYPGESPVLTGRLKITGSWFRVAGLTFDGQYQLDDSLIWPDTPAANIEISGNTITRAGLTGSSSHSGNGIFISPGTSNVQILRNSIHDNGTSSQYHHGIYLSGTGHLIDDNLIYDNSAYGIQCYPDCDNAIITNNTVVGNGRSGIIVGSDGSTTSSNDLIVNNIVAFNTENGIRTFWGGPVGSAIANDNLAYGNPQGDYWADGGGLTVTSPRSGDPQFADRSGNDYHTLVGSPAIDAGLAPDAPLTDIAGVQRPQGAGPDLGAYER